MSQAPAFLNVDYSQIELRILGQLDHFYGFNTLAGWRNRGIWRSFYVKPPAGSDVVSRLATLAPTRVIPVAAEPLAQTLDLLDRSKDDCSICKRPPVLSLPQRIEHYFPGNIDDVAEVKQTDRRADQRFLARQR